VSFNVFAISLIGGYILLYGLYLKFSSTKQVTNGIAKTESDDDEISDEFIEENFSVEYESALDGKTQEQLRQQLIMTFRALNNAQNLNLEASRNEQYNQRPEGDSIDTLIDGVETESDTAVLSDEDMLDIDDLITDVIIDPN